MNRDSLRTEIRDEEKLCRALRSLPARIPPADLATRLRILASRERIRRSRTWTERSSAWIEKVRFAAASMMRPFALPVAGGLFSAVALFTMWLVPTYPLRAVGSLDVPTSLTTQPAVRGMIPMDMESSGEAVVDVTIDDQGRMVDYKVVAGAAILTNATLRRRLENTLLFTEFIPATSFGKPMTSSVVRVSLVGLSQVDVKG